MKNWIKSAIKRKGALRSKAPKKAFTKRGTLKKSWLKKEAKSKGRTGKQARLALTLRKFRSKKH